MAGSIQHLGGDRYRVRVYIGKDPITGKERTRSRTFTHTGSKVARKRAAADIANDLLKGVHEAAQARGTVAELAKDWLELKRRQGRSPLTIEGYETIVKRIVERFGAMQVADLTGRDIDRWYGELLDEKDKKTKEPVRSAATVQHYHAVLRGMLRQAEKWELAPSVATRRASPPEATATDVVVPPTPVLEVLFADAGHGDFLNILRFTAATGLRAGELAGLMWSDFDGDQLHIRRAVIEPKGGARTKVPKGKRSRRMTIGADVLEVLDDQRAYIAAQAEALSVPVPTSGAVFPDMASDPTGQTPRLPGWISHRWIKLRNRHGVTFRLHDLRHWNATALLNAGQPMAVVSERLGHAKQSTTSDIYSHVIEGSDRAAAVALTGLVPKRRPPLAS